MHAIPDDFKRAVFNNSKAKETWDKTTPLAKNEWACWITSAKMDTTRERRIKVGCSKLASGIRRPCCWAGCPHR